MIGTGATGVQVIQTIAPQVGQLTVFQRTPNWCTPLHNRADHRGGAGAASRPATRRCSSCCAATPGCYIHDTDPRGTFEVTEEEREAFWEQRYSEPGFGIWMANFRDVLTDPEANALFSDFIARKIRQRVKDPAVAEKLIPKCHGFGTRRVPQETGFYEAFNLPHVRLVDTRETPIERITPSRHPHQRCRVRVRHHHLRHRLRRHHRQLRPHRLPRHRRAAAEGPLGGRAEDLSRPDVGRLPQPADHRRAAQRLHPLQHPALHRAERGLGDRAAAPHAGDRHDAGRGDAGGRGRVVGAYRGTGRGHALYPGRFLGDRHQQQCRGQDGPPHPAIPGRRAAVPGALRCGGGSRAMPA